MALVKTWTPLVVTFADEKYLPLLKLWQRSLAALGIRRMRIYALDTVTERWCRDHRLETERLVWGGDLRELWILRIGVFLDLLRGGEEFIHSDIDAIWLKNPLQHGSAATCKEDILFSPGTISPRDVHAQWGFVLCCGWFWARVGSTAFFDVLKSVVASTGDDQVALNRCLCTMGLTWNSDTTVPDYTLKHQDRRVHCWTRPISAAVGSDFSVALMPHREFQRIPEPFSGVVVKHYRSPKDCDKKIQQLRGLGLLP